MLQLLSDSGGMAVGLVTVALALFWLGRALRSDTRLSRRLEDRITKLETGQERDGRRIAQLENVLRAHGIPVPPWPITDDDPYPTATARSAS